MKPRILFVEDTDDDVVLELAELRRNGFDVEYEVVETPAALRAALTRPWEVVISDFRMPEMSGLEALAIVREHDPVLPFILVSGTVGEDIAVTAMRAGAQDYLLKDNLQRLGPAVGRELQELEARRRGHASETAFRVLADAGALLATTLDPNERLDRLATLCVDRLGELCVIEVAETGGMRSIVRGDSAAAHRLSSPMRAGDSMIGTLHVARGRPYARWEQEVVQELAHRAAIAIENARLFVEARRAIDLRDEFLVIASHELKTPLTAAELDLRAVSVMLRNDERAAAKLGRLGRSLARLGSLIDSLLDVTDVATRGVTLTLERFDLAKIVSAAAAHDDVSLDVEPVVGEWDRTRLEQLVTALLSNAVKYRGKHPIEVRLRGGDRARLEIIDHGSGIAAEDRTRVFERFERAVPWRNYGGLGLGLYVAREIVRAHGGSIAITDTPGGGATLAVELPLTSTQ